MKKQIAHLTNQIATLTSKVESDITTIKECKEKGDLLMATWWENAMNTKLATIQELCGDITRLVVAPKPTLSK